MIYFVQPGDTLWKIAMKTGTAIDNIIGYNILCNPNLIFPGQLLYIKEPGTQPLISDRYPYYIIKPGDTLWCIAYRLGYSNQVERFYSLNKDRIKDMNRIYPGTELVVSYPGTSEPGYWVDQLLDALSRENCSTILSSEKWNNFGTMVTFYLETFGEDAIPHIMKMFNNPCYAVRYFALVSLGRIASWRPDVLDKLNELSNDPNEIVSEMAKLVLKRTELVQSIGKRTHITIKDVDVLAEPRVNSLVKRKYSKGSPFITHKWFIPYFGSDYSAIYDYVEFLETGETGFIQVYQTRSGNYIPEAPYPPSYFI